MKPLLFYVDPAWRREGAHHTPLLNPWWGNAVDPSSLFAYEMFETYAFDTSCYGITAERAQADLVLAPYRHNWLLQHEPALLKACAATAEGAGIPLLLDGTGDIEYPVGIRNSFVLRYGGYRFKDEPGRIQVPLNVDDLLERCRGGVFSPRPKGAGKPVVGFAGWTKLSLKNRARAIAKELPVRLRGVFDSRYRACTKGVFWRQRALGLLARSPLVSLSIRQRSTFSANPRTAERDMRELREEMVETILGSDYALDVRGDANNSARLFEILSLGRIPVIVDTERNLPFKDAVDYASFALIVDFRAIETLPERIAEFHATVSPERFEQMQRDARDAYRKHLRIDAVMPHIVEELRRGMGASSRA